MANCGIQWGKGLCRLSFLFKPEGNFPIGQLLLSSSDMQSCGSPMNKRILLEGIILLVIAGMAHAQQVADLEYKPPIAQPAYEAGKRPSGLNRIDKRPSPLPH
jgi:hypothetical protein